MVLNKHNKRFFIIFCTVMMALQSSAAAAERKNATFSYISQHEYISVVNSDQCDGVITLDSPGRYKVLECLEYPLVIAASNITCDVNGYSISSRQTQALVSVAADVSDVVVYNGTLEGIQQQKGVVIECGAARIVFDHLKIVDCDCGVLCAGTHDKKIIDCEMRRLELAGNVVGMRLVCVQDSIVRECSAVRCTSTGFDVQSCESILLHSCQALKTAGEGNTVAFRAGRGENNVFQRCGAKNTATRSCALHEAAYGFLLSDGEKNTKIIECSVNDTACTNSGAACAYGICCSSVVDHDMLDVKTVLHDNALPLSLAWSCDSQYCACGYARSDSHSVCVYKYDGQVLTRAAEHVCAGDVFAIVWSPDGHYLVSGDSAGFLRVFLFNGESLEEIVYEDIVSPVSSLAWSPDGKILACGDGDKNIRLFHFDGKMLTQKSMIDDCAASVLSLSWSPDGRSLASGDFGGYVRVYSVYESRATHVTQTCVGEHAWSVAWSPRGNFLLVGDQSGAVRIFECDGQELKQRVCVACGQGAVQSVAWSPDAHYVVWSDMNGGVAVARYDGDNLEFVDKQKFSDSVYSVAWSYDGSTIISGDSAYNVQLYNALCCPKDCLVENCRVCDTCAGKNHAFGIAGSGSFMHNLSCNNDVNYGSGIGNVVYGKHNKARNTAQAFDNVSMPAV